ncbi:DMT family transporter [Dactylosporangium aurantiacum]|uniref:DMT family transporter n=1 Tax=Dactylosporangium aurantiacum TaxID=35754 RepID=A0A9Q9IGW6_9ACTN|nr:EamA family transporter [Dactylosporangium aurantiacum]MDG6108248.1 EamA family transporter [Dactylosporangium aurantiacum]UWZ53767.1 DMT family transporter [Dactylosporangium aurantiacum]
MLSLLFAATSALIWGAGDFAGGKASQRTNSVGIALVAELAGIPLVIGWLLVTRPGVPAAADLGWGAAAGVLGVAGLVVFYRALSGGAMSVVAPLTATTTAAVPLLLGLVLDRRPSTLALAGAVLAVVAITLVSAGPSAGGTVSKRLVAAALAAGVLFGGYFTLLAQTSHESGMWPLLSGRVAGAVGLLVAMRLMRVPTRMDGTSVVLAGTAGVFDVTANAFYLMAVRDGMLSIAAPIASLYPVSTVFLAMAVDRERMRPLQITGLGLAAAALVLSAA